MLRVWRALPRERRLAAGASLLLFLTLFLPWYQETVIATEKTTKLLSASDTVTGWGAFSFVEAAVLLVAVAVLTLLFQRAEGRAFHLPGGDGWIVTIAGGWTCCLIVWRIFDKQGTSSHGQLATTWGIEWGIFVALLVAGLLTYAGNLIRAAHTPEPPLPGEPGPRTRPSRRGAAAPAPADAATAPAPADATSALAPTDAAPAPRRVKRAPGPPGQAPRKRQVAGERPVGWLTSSPDGVSTDRTDAPPRILEPPPAWSYRDEVGEEEATRQESAHGEAEHDDSTD
jgi:hypothetical protein